eukprot:812333-Alexandrium_andersonii.AAC.1
MNPEKQTLVAQAPQRPPGRPLNDSWRALGMLQHPGVLVPSRHLNVRSLRSRPCRRRDGHPGAEMLRHGVCWFRVDI